jgi:hypothetical protein
VVVLRCIESPPVEVVLVVVSLVVVGAGTVTTAGSGLTVSSFL